MSKVINERFDNGRLSLDLEMRFAANMMRGRLLALWKKLKFSNRPHKHVSLSPIGNLRGEFAVHIFTNGDLKVSCYRDFLDYYSVVIGDTQGTVRGNKSKCMDQAMDFAFIQYTEKRNG